jgi:hypothetical protein
MTVLAYVPDLMDRSKVSGAAPGVEFVGTAAALLGRATEAAPPLTIVVDLSRPGVLDALAALAATDARVIGFGSHVDAELLRRAREVGCQTVLARSAFFSRVRELLA